jgi:hypothetical protein
LFKGIGVALVAEIDHHLDPLRRREAHVILDLGAIGLREAVEDPDESFLLYTATWVCLPL